MSGEEKIVVQHHRSATENRYTHTPHAVRLSHTNPRQKNKNSARVAKTAKFPGSLQLLYFIPDKAFSGTRVKTISKAICFRTDASIAFP